MENSLSGQLDNDAAFDKIMAQKTPNVGENIPSGAMSDEEAFNKVMSGSGGASPFGGPPTGAPKGPRPTASRYHQAGAKLKPEEKELTFGQAVQGAGQSFLPSTVEMGKGMVSAVTHPAETLGAIGQIGTGFASQAAGALGATQDPAKKAKDEALAKALQGHYAQTYGSWKGFKKALGTDPASIAMDLSTLVLGPAGAGAKGAGLVKTGAALSKAAEFTDPIQLALKTAKLPFRAAGKIVPLAQSFSTGKDANFLAMAAKAASSKATPEERAAFQAHMTKKAQPSEIVDRIDYGLDELAKKRSADYIKKQKALTGGNLQPLSFQNLTDAFKDRVQQNRVTDPRTGFFGVKNPNVESIMDEIGTEISRYSAQPVNSVAHTLEGFDALKQYINQIRNKYKNDPQAYQAGTLMHKEILKELIAKEPEYGKLMNQYSRASDEMAAIRERFGAGRNLSDETVLKKVMKSKFGKGKESENLLSALSQYDSTIPYMIAGHALSDVFPGGLRQALMYSAPLNPAGLVGGAAHLAASSPRAMGSLNYAAGTVGRQIGTLTQPAVTKALTYAGQQRNEANQIKPAAATAPPVTATGAPPAPTVTGDKTFDAMLHQESGSRQFRQDGTLIESPKGAMGISQIMKETGPEAAKLAGETWDLERAKTDEAYNLKLGKAYFDSLVGKYGDPIIAAGDYNCGPGAMDRAIEKARYEGGSWVDYVPNETKNYVKNVAARSTAATGGRIERASGGRTVDSRHEALVNKLMNKAKKAKFASNKITEPLLDIPDKAIVKALDVAQQAI